MEQSIKSRVLKTEPIEWRKLLFLQDESFKDFSDEARQKLKNSVISNDFSQPFYVWEDVTDGSIYCLDGMHRTKVLEELAGEGYTIPEQLPATFMECEDKQQAAKMVLIFSSMYARVTSDGLQGFAELHDIDLSLMKDVMDIPYMESILPVMPMPTDLEGDGKAKPAVMRITFESAEDLEAATGDIDAILKQKYPGAFFSVSCGEI